LHYTERAALYVLDYKLVLHGIKKSLDAGTDMALAASDIVSEVHVMVKWKILIRTENSYYHSSNEHIFNFTGDISELCYMILTQ
jgi:hypothetical protein